MWLVVKYIIGVRLVYMVRKNFAKLNLNPTDSAPIFDLAIRSGDVIYPLRGKSNPLLGSWKVCLFISRIIIGKAEAGNASATAQCPRNLIKDIK